MHKLDDCIFCQIIQGKAPCHLVHEDELTMTVMDIFPVSPGHLLILSKEHCNDIFDANPAVLAAVAANSVHIAKALLNIVELDGLGVHQLNRAAAGQTVFHYHMHLIPRKSGEDIAFLHSREPGDSQQLAQLAEQLRRQLQQQTIN